jgi:hypothetical protein
MLALYAILICLGVLLWISGSQPLSTEVKQGLAPQDVEWWELELHNRRLWGQTLILCCVMVAVILVI